MVPKPATTLSQLDVETAPVFSSTTTNRPNKATSVMAMAVGMLVVVGISEACI
jgi:hypothetical protein